MAENGTPVPEPLTTLGLRALPMVRTLVETSELRTARSLRVELAVKGISNAVGKFSKLVLLHPLLKADTTTS